MEHRPYYSANQYYRELFGEKAYKLSLDAGMTCPNRDGTLDMRGCIFCSAGGSGDFAQGAADSVAEQLDGAIARIAPKYSGGKYIAYFQAFTGTYAPLQRLREIFIPAAEDARIAGISIATRPDCLEDCKIEFLKELAKRKPVWVELGLQTVNEKTAKYIRRGYELPVFEDTLSRLKLAGIPVTVHIIVGLPGENRTDYIKCAEYLADRQVEGVKIQLLHVLRGTDLAADYEAGLFSTMERDDYIRTVVDMLELLPPDTVIHRLTGDGPRKILIAPQWSTDKKNILNLIHREFKTRSTYQGRKYRNGSRINDTL
ncbi:MAG: TIGR01212 family radical SAM protein [Butyrivibrio sp.]|nr:TIGR01212 family radical SAM protein [Butyrivibrio sp.]